MALLTKRLKLITILFVLTILSTSLVLSVEAKEWRFHDSHVWVDLWIYVNTQEKWTMGESYQVELKIEIENVDDDFEKLLIYSVEMGFVLTDLKWDEEVDEELDAVGDWWKATTSGWVATPSEFWAIGRGEIDHETFYIEVHGVQYYHSYTGEIKTSDIWIYESFKIEIYRPTEADGDSDSNIPMVPGFPIETIIIGVLLTTSVLMILRKRKTPI